MVLVVSNVVRLLMLDVSPYFIVLMSSFRAVEQKEWKEDFNNNNKIMMLLIGRFLLLALVL